MATRTFRRVELARVGTHSASTGKIVLSAEDLADVVAASRDPLTGRAVIKIGHIDPRFRNPSFDGEPVYGQVENLSLDGDTLYGDLVNVPDALAEDMPSSYPSRSVEIAYNLRTRAGTVRRRVLTAVSLLGATRPAIADLAPVTAAAAAAEDWEGVIACAAADDTAGLPTATLDAPPPLGDATPARGGHDMALSAAVLARLGLTAEDADDEAKLLAALDHLTPPAAAPPAPPAAPDPSAPPVLTVVPPAAPAPVVPVAVAASGLTPAEVATFSEMEQRLAALTLWQTERIQADAAAAIDAAIYRFSADPTDGGRVTPYTEPLWRDQLAKDFDGTVKLLSASPRLYYPTPAGLTAGPDATDPGKAQYERAVADAKALGLHVYEPQGA